ncbi:hypothetical protein, variant 3 [Aphanomyces astaci]|uniref:CULT domain-containing protein n=1 Tax=Aphanomyces astaci TaxID=112090 RepID=W4G9S2_APHAT|nr:hypothetical protein, variant 2 [Aphanomyces astaci]XP_009833992.1 hypothetical protein, variant 3 [Aphanomyces astaci]ETV76446.1 hypothetical protein, variant 2 [Aphanomyces astaci]ETV76447.1 hypothetical protein, variant 3 [Aphanomyces astaci]|eukprot:XP_009833990.1 hypothetical protein, variant 2 [Aphanomyces astaci]
MATNTCRSLVAAGSDSSSWTAYRCITRWVSSWKACPRKFASCPTFTRCLARCPSISGAAAPPRPCNTSTSSHSLSFPDVRKRRRPSLVAYWGPQQYMQFDGPSLVYQAKSILLQSVEYHAFMASTTNSTSSAAMSAPSDPTRFSYWLAAHLNLGLATRQRLLATSCVVGRLRALIEWLHHQSAVIQCSGCATTLAHTRAIFLKQDADHGGPASTFVNPYGAIHQILTMLAVERATYDPVGTPSLADTWFPGYTWQCISCVQCATFLGWRYVSTVEQAHPRVFFGLLRNAIG